MIIPRVAFERWFPLRIAGDWRMMAGPGSGADSYHPKEHLLRRMNVFVAGVLADMHQQLNPLQRYRPPVDPELMIRRLIVGYRYGIRHERRPWEVKLRLAYRWFRKL